MQATFETSTPGGGAMTWALRVTMAGLTIDPRAKPRSTAAMVLRRGFMAGWDGGLAEARAEGEEKGAEAVADRGGGRARGAADLRR